MTNGEKIKEIFPTFEFIKETEKDRTPQHQFLKVYGVNKVPYMEFDLGLWNAEYKEPTTKNDLGDDTISRNTVLTLINDVKNANGFSEYSQYEYLFDQVDTMPSVTPQKIVPIAEIKYDEEKLKELVDKAVFTTVIPQEREVLDKIRAEIIELRSRQNVGVLECLDIIDKYKAESEET